VARPHGNETAVMAVAIPISANHFLEIEISKKLTAVSSCVSVGHMRDFSQVKSEKNKNSNNFRVW
jgi:hypothetical protein